MRNLFALYISCYISVVQAEIINNIEDSYDYVIVGGGTAGAVLANRLSAVLHIKVLILEAGYEPHRMSNMPFFAPVLQQTELDWAYKTVPQKNSCFGIKQRRSRWPRGKALGGSSVINYMMYVRGNKKDYDNWAKNGATGWSWNDVFPYFLKSEYNEDYKMTRNGYHGTNGELPVSRTNFYTPLAEDYVKAAKELNHLPGDVNGPNQETFMVIQGMIRNGERWSTHRAFLKPIMRRRNLHIAIGAFVTQILFDNSNRAIGVKFEYKNQTKTVLAKIEVILSAGAINSPHLLMLSGIGPREDLQRLGIPVYSDLPVGKNLQDHLTTLVPFVIDQQVTLEIYRVVLLGMVTFYFGEGPLSSMGVESLGFFSTKYNNETNWPDMELIFISYSPASDGGIIGRNMHGITDEMWEKVFKPFLTEETIACVPMLLRPESIGEIKLVSNNPYEHPSIDPKYFSKPKDLKVFVEGLKKCLEFANTKTMQKYGIRPFNVSYPGCEKYRLYSDEYLACMAQTYSLTIYHPCGTCKMGAASDPTTVVDPELRVKGVKNLRVVDSSIIPIINSGHVEAPTIMIAEKASDMILADYYTYRSNEIIR